MSHVLMVDDDANTREALAALAEQPDSEQTPMRNCNLSSSLSATPPSNGPAITVALGTPLSVAARELILSTLEHCGGERKRTAEMLGICTKTLYNRLREYGIREEQGRAAMGDPRAKAAEPSLRPDR